MKILIRCEFCNQVIPLKELGLKDETIGNMCRLCYAWLNEEFMPLARRTP